MGHTFKTWSFDIDSSPPLLSRVEFIVSEVEKNNP